MKQVMVLLIVLVFFAFLVVPASAQLYSPENYPSNIGTGFDATLQFLQGKAEEDRKQRELQERERQRRLRESVITNVPERLLESYFNRRSDAPYNRR
jgi:hypothetical protein